MVKKKEERYEKVVESVTNNYRVDFSLAVFLMILFLGNIIIIVLTLIFGWQIMFIPDLMVIFIDAILAVICMNIIGDHLDSRKVYFRRIK
jgi:hypothetical protein